MLDTFIPKNGKKLIDNSEKKGIETKSIRSNDDSSTVIFFSNQVLSTCYEDKAFPLIANKLYPTIYCTFQTSLLEIKKLISSRNRYRFRLSILYNSSFGAKFYYRKNKNFI
jgi:hypothetical protein